MVDLLQSIQFDSTAWIPFYSPVVFSEFIFFAANQNKKSSATILFIAKFICHEENGERYLLEKLISNTLRMFSL